MFLKALVCSMLLSVAVVATSHAATIFSSFGPSDSFDTNTLYTATGSATFFGTEAFGAAFTVSAEASVTGVDLPMQYKSGTDSVFLSFWTDVGGLPGTEIGSTFTAVPPAALGLVAITGITGVDLAAGQTYFLVLMPGAADTFSDWGPTTRDFRNSW